MVLQLEGLGEVLTTPHRKNVRCDNRITRPRTCADSLADDGKVAGAIECGNYIICG